MDQFKKKKLTVIYYIIKNLNIWESQISDNPAVGNNGEEEDFLKGGEFIHQWQ